MFDTKQMTDMAEKFSEIYKNTGLDPAKFTEAFSKMTPPNYANNQVKQKWL